MLHPRRSTINRLDRSGRLAGLLVAPSPTPAAFSPAAPIPNQRFGLYRNTPVANQHVWNPNGMSFDAVSFNFPMAMVHPADLKGFQEAADANARVNFNSFPLAAAELDNFMFASQSSDDCLRRCT